MGMKYAQCFALLAASGLIQAAELKWGLNDVDGIETTLIRMPPTGSIGLPDPNAVPIYRFMATVKVDDSTINAVVITAQLLMRDGSQIERTLLLIHRTNQYLSGLTLLDSDIDKVISISIDLAQIKRRAAR